MVTRSAPLPTLRVKSAYDVGVVAAQLADGVRQASEETKSYINPTDVRRKNRNVLGTTNTSSDLSNLTALPCLSQLSGFFNLLLTSTTSSASKS